MRHSRASQVAQWDRTYLSVQETQETWVWSLGWEDPVEKQMATHSSILAWRVAWAEEPGGQQFMGSPRVRHDWTTERTGTRDPAVLFFARSINSAWDGWGWGQGCMRTDKPPDLKYEQKLNSYYLSSSNAGAISQRAKLTVHPISANKHTMAITLFQKIQRCEWYSFFSLFPPTFFWLLLNDVCFILHLYIFHFYFMRFSCRQLWLNLVFLSKWTVHCF